MTRTRSPRTRSSRPRLVVVGSINLDMRVNVVTLPEPGATVLGTGLASGPGGKGANQAVAAARLGADVSFIGSVGSDDAGARLRAALAAAGVATEGLSVAPGPSGLAIIEVDEAGQNRIVVISGANQAVTPDSLGPDDTRAAGVGPGSSGPGALHGADVVLLQLEIPLATVRRAAALGRKAGALVVLNAAPATSLTAEDLGDVGLLVVNEIEAAALRASLGLAGRPAATHPLTPMGAAASLTAIVPSVVITLGAAGAVWAERGAAGWPVRHASHREGRQPAFPVTTVDTTGAGDTFVGALGVRLGAGDDMQAALRYASAAAAISTTRPGAQESVPDASEVEAMLAAATGAGDVA